MTYDFHGQWDAGNKWSSPGCEEGNCLRSHINFTETHAALTMVTKAGVSSKKIFVGIASYGRSFKMATEGCYSPDCHFTGTANISYAAPGPCIKTSGYISSAEIRDIIWQGGDEENTGVSVHQYHDGASNSDIIVYNDDEWVAWMSDVTKSTRTDWVKRLNFGGVSDWAADLDKDYKGIIGSSGGEHEDNAGGFVCPQRSFDSLEALENDIGSVGHRRRAIYTLETLQKMLAQALTKFKDVNNGYDDKFNSYAKYMKKEIPVKLTEYMEWRSGAKPPHGVGQKFFDCSFVGGGRKWQGHCPVPNSEIGDYKIRTMDITYTVRDQDGLYKSLATDIGVDGSWTEYGEASDDHPCYQTGPAPCNGFWMKLHKVPTLKSDFQMPDPKAIVENALPGIEELAVAMTAGIMDITLGIWEGNNEDLAEVLAMPVFLFIQAIESMENAKEIGEHLEEEERNNLIITIITALLFFVPFVGEIAAAAAGMATVARMIALAGIAGNTALTIVDIIEDPEMAPMAILGLLTGGRLRSPKDYKDAAKAKRAMSSTDIGKMGATYQKHDVSVQNILKSCNKK